MKKLSLFAFALCALVFASCGGNNQKKEEKSLTLYCAAGIKKPVSELAKEYTKKYGVAIDIQYGGSGTLLSNLQVSKKGDLYLAGEESYLQTAREKNLVAEIQPLATMRPMIVVHKGNPKKIAKIEDFLRDDVKVSIANPEVAAVGIITRDLFTKLGKWEALQEKTKVFKPTVNELVLDVNLGAIDACIAWNTMASQFKDVETIEIDSEANLASLIEIGVLNSTTQPQEALKFVRYLSSKDFGNPVFAKYGFHPVEGDAWAEKPNIVLFSGGVNRLAVEPVIQNFEKREGIEVTRVYNGCGILVAQIKAGNIPDAYLTCDRSFMDMVSSKFDNIQDITDTKIIIITQKGNPKGIKTLKDLSAKGLRVGSCNPEQSALGYIVKGILEKQNLWNQILPNICSQTPTADLLVNQLRTGALDAALVYISNVTKVKDKVDIIFLDDSAVQNYGIVKTSNNRWIMKRFLEALHSQEAVESYKNNGMTVIENQ